ncbi:hypothetical protein [Luteipulveratus mongoliensis]|uniref:Uncharacterized protein n=1 Tax=Luteipulveratus mongoliensis TaxID=571913 RepID=A0A0K1JE02_9MICO|nr:hypothetical protein [Luteipulveratus mongoliensis]AKU14934.1 hypothetical protein VV02_02060 [Luteipulveratus mongoliensis]
MLFRKSRSEKVRDSADDLASAAVGVLGSVKDKVAPLVEDAVDRAAPAAKSALDKAKETAAPAAERAKEATDRAKAASQPALDKAKDGSAKDAVASFARPARAKVAAAAESAAPAAGRAKAKVAEAAAPAVERAQEAGLTRDQAHSLFAEEWLPRIQQAIAAAGATTTAAVAKLPEPAQDAVAKVAPAVVKRKKKGKLLIAVGVLALAGAGALYFSGQQKKKAAGDPWQQASGHGPEPVDTPLQDSTNDLVGDTERHVDAALTAPGGATPRSGRHSAN